MTCLLFFLVCLMPPARVRTNANNEFFCLKKKVYGNDELPIDLARRWMFSDPFAAVQNNGDNNEIEWCLGVVLATILIKFNILRRF